MNTCFDLKDDVRYEVRMAIKWRDNNEHKPYSINLCKDEAIRFAEIAKKHLGDAEWWSNTGIDGFHGCVTEIWGIWKITEEKVEVY